jgi:hypothetical protein
MLTDQIATDPENQPNQWGITEGEITAVQVCQGCNRERAISQLIAWKDTDPLHQELRPPIVRRGSYAYRRASDAIRGLTCEHRPVADWLRLPWSLVRYAFAWTWATFWYPIAITRNWPYGRYTQPDPVMCPVCWWAGPIRWLYHTYTGDEEISEAVDECPRCGIEM